MWWFTPPPENRYLISLIAPLIIILLYSVTHLSHKLKPIKTASFIGIITIILINLTIRAYFTHQRLPVILGLQSKQDYINSQTTDFNRDIIEKYYSNYWQDYKY